MCPKSLLCVAGADVQCSSVIFQEESHFVCMVECEVAMGRVMCACMLCVRHGAQMVALSSGAVVFLSCTPNAFAE
jgi:hypothetical protein